MGVWMLMTYISLTLFRSIHLVGQIDADYNFASFVSNAKKSKMLRVFSLISIFLVFPFICVWTILGNIWFTQIKLYSPYCLSQPEDEWLIVFWLFINYTYIFTYVVILVIAAYLYVQEYKVRKSLVQFIRSVGIDHIGDLAEFDYAQWRERNNNIELLAEYGIHFFSPGLTQHEISQIPTRFILPDDISGGRCRCSICLESFEVGDKVRCVQPCGDVFHIPCLDIWVGRDASCPNCKLHLLPFVFEYETDTSMLQEPLLS